MMREGVVLNPATTPTPREREREREREGGGSRPARRCAWRHSDHPSASHEPKQSERERGRSSKTKRGERKWRPSGSGNGEDGGRW